MFYKYIVFFKIIYKITKKNIGIGGNGVYQVQMHKNNYCNV